MRQIAPVLVLCLLSFQTSAESVPEAPPPLLEGLDELADGMRQLFEGLSDEVVPLMEGLADRLKGLDAYHAPEVLLNGDIIIRRKTPLEQESDPDSHDGGVIDI